MDDDEVLRSDMAEACTGLHGTILTGRSQVIGSMSKDGGAISQTSGVSFSLLDPVGNSDIER